MSSTTRKESSYDLSILSLKIDEESLTAKISDGRIVSIPIAWFSSSANATPSELQNFEISPGGYGISWPELEEDISIKSFIE